MCAMWGTSRVVRVRLAVIAALLCTAAARPAWANSLSPSLTLSPERGPASGAVTMTFNFAFILLCPAGQVVTFSWDGAAIATAALDAAACSGSALVVPPAGASAPGAHTVVATSGSQAASAAFTVLATPPSATAARAPTSRRTPSASQRRTPSPTPTATPAPVAAAAATPPSPPCDTRVPQATGAGGYLQAPGLAGAATEPQHAGAIVVRSLLPPTMLPPVVGTVSLTEVALIRPVDSSSQALMKAVASRTHFDCVQLEMGPAERYLYATYAFHDAFFSSYSPASDVQPGDERLTLIYLTVDWEYQLRDGTPVASGTGKVGSAPVPRPLQQAGMSSAPLVLIGAVLLGACGVLWYLPRVRRRWNRWGRSPHL
jgi:type VI protein secretion system component Hcp